MELDAACNTLALMQRIGIQSVSLLGGEPSMYPHLESLIAYAQSLNIETVLITNGVMLSDSRFVDCLFEAGLSHADLSLKGFDRVSFFDVTGYDYYDFVMDAVKNLSSGDHSFNVSFVLSAATIPGLAQGLLDCYQNGARQFSLFFCNDCAGAFGTKVHSTPGEAYELAELFRKEYRHINTATQGEFDLLQTLPLCAWNKEVVQMMRNANQIESVCQLLHESGLVVSTDGSIIPCNSLYNISLGDIASFWDKSRDEFLEYWNSTNVTTTFNRLKALPGTACKGCKDYELCAGGCVIQWFNYSFEDFADGRRFL